MDIKLLEKYAKLVVKTGANVHKDQGVLVNCSPEHYEFARLVTKECYEAGAKFVMVDFNDNVIQRLHFINQSQSQLEAIPDFLTEKHKYLIDENVAKIHLISPDPESLKGVDAKKIQGFQMASASKFSFVREWQNKNLAQWTIAALPNEAWAKKVFPDLNKEDGIGKLWDAILKASRVNLDTCPVTNWEEHIKQLDYYRTTMNNHNFKSLHFTNTLGTDLIIDLIKDHIWAGGAEDRQDGHRYAPNIPTEEIFSMPHKYGANGTLVATMPLNYQGKLIDGFKMTFKDGKVVSYDAKEELETLKNLIEFDEGSAYLGEVALISDNSPINNMNILFYNTLFDENASCHLALGSAYNINIKDGIHKTKEELKKLGVNDSKTHVDFMFGSKCMNIKGITYDDKEIQVFKDGNFVF